MAGHKRPSFLKKQKEQQRKVWATEKRAARQARREAKNTEGPGSDGIEEATLEDVTPDDGTSAEVEPAKEDATRQ